MFKSSDLLWKRETKRPIATKKDIKNYPHGRFVLCNNWIKGCWGGIPINMWSGGYGGTLWSPLSHSVSAHKPATQQIRHECTFFHSLCFEHSSLLYIQNCMWGELFFHFFLRGNFFRFFYVRSNAQTTRLDHIQNNNLIYIFANYVIISKFA
jgi:hypothetical protein